MRPYLFDYNVPSEFTTMGSTKLYLPIKATYITEFSDGSLAVLCEVFDVHITTLSDISQMSSVANDIQKIAVQHFQEKMIAEKVINEMKLKRA